MNNRLPLLGMTLLMVFGSACLAAAQEWTRFRGPNGSGVSEAATIPAQWTEKDYRWRVELPGVGHSSPVVWGDRLYVTSALPADGTLVVRCLDTADGRTVWEVRFASSAHPKHQFNSYASSTPTVDARRLYVAYATPEKYNVVALDRASGEEVWRRDLGPFVSQHGFGASPILYEGLLILANEQDEKSSVVALDAVSGETRWSCPRRTEKAAFATPCVYTPRGGAPQLIVNSWAHGISSIDAATGRPNWEVPEFRYRVVGSPVLAGGLIFGSCGSGGVGHQMLAVRPPKPGTDRKAEVAYTLTGSLPYVCTPVAYGALLFSWFDRGVVTCLDAPTGKILWRERVKGDYFSSPIRVRDRIYNATRDGEMVVLAASSEFQPLARFSLGEATNATPAVSGGVMYLRTVGHVMAVGGK